MVLVDVIGGGPGIQEQEGVTSPHGFGTDI